MSGFGRYFAAAIMTAAMLCGESVSAAENSDTRREEAACLYERSVGGKPVCIRKDFFNTDLCSAIERSANSHAIPPDFFARLIWRESLFRPEAVSHKGAEGIAQFMPSTARMRGLGNSFHVLDALDASAAYLKEMSIRFGNLGFAAAAYNAGENGFSRFLASDRLPIETRDYVFAITGTLIETWRDDPPEIAAPPLDNEQSFQEACTMLASTRRMTEPVLTTSADWAPWGVQLAAHHRPAVVDRLFTRVILGLPAPLNEERALIVRQRGGNFGYRPRYAARIGRETRQEAVKLCGAIKAAGVPCTVFRNR
jgi:soluble lytic murein transglycosylase-like protein